VALRERFLLFPLERTEQRTRAPGWGYDAIPTFVSTATLDVDGRLPLLPMQFWVAASGVDANQAFTPFQPELGYQVTNDDFDPMTRSWKVTQSPYRDRQLRAIPQALSAVSAALDPDARVLATMLDPEAGPIPLFRPEVRAVLARLQFQVVFPTGARFAAEPEIGSGSVVYDDGFYPFDAGPLAVPDTGGAHLWSPGLRLAVPPDPGRLAQIEGRFVLR
jgi:hypothetical protein